MNVTLTRICALLKSPKAELQAAAAIVLGQIAPKEPRVVKLIGAALESSPKPVRLHLLDALGSIGSGSAVPFLLPLLESHDDEVRDRATRALIEIGPAAIKPVAKEILDAPPTTRRAIMAVFSRVKTLDSIQSLTSLIESGHPEAAREAAMGLISLQHEMKKTELSKVRSIVERILRTPPAKAPEGALSAALLAMGAVGRPANAQALLRLTGTRYPEPIRRDALLAIAAVLKGSMIPQKILAGIMPLIHDGPSPALRSAALEALETLQLPASAQPNLLAQLEHRDPAVRRFAARKLGAKEMGGVKVARRLLRLLPEGAPAMREIISSSLAGMPEATAPLVEHMLSCRDVHRAWGLAEVLRHHAGRLRKPAARKIFDRALEALRKDDRVWEPLLNVLRHHDPKIMYEWLMVEAARLKKARKYAEAEVCLRPLTRGDHFDNEARYALALAAIKAARVKGGGAGPSADNCIELFRQLVHEPSFPLVDRLKKERKHISADELYFLGFRLAEGSPIEKETGAELLRMVAARAGSTKLGRSARSKLRSEGLML